MAQIQLPNGRYYFDLPATGNIINRRKFFRDTAFSTAGIMLGRKMSGSNLAELTLKDNSTSASFNAAHWAAVGTGPNMAIYIQRSQPQMILLMQQNRYPRQCSSMHIQAAAETGNMLARQ